MNAPTPREASAFWTALIGLNQQADGLVSRVQRAIEPTQPISREIPVFATIEAKFNDLTGLSTVPPTGSDAIAGNNIKQPIYTNGSSRVYIREIGISSEYVLGPDESINANARIPNNFTDYPFNFRWNFYTSITQRWYSTPRGCLVAASGREVKAGNRIAFRQPLVIEPMETLVFQCELLSFFTTDETLPTSAIVTMTLSGYREGD